MNTAITIADLARAMRDHAARAFKPEIRSTGETDQILLGKLEAFDLIAEGICWDEINAADDDQLMMIRDRGEVDRAIRHLNSSREVKNAKRAKALGIA